MSMGLFWLLAVVVYAIAFVNHWFGGWALLAIAAVYGVIWLSEVLITRGEQRRR